jgi:uncharacterized RDD family membrane protein YckC
MNCAYCQTWILDGEHRCRRCGRRLKPAGIHPDVFPVSSEATARAYDFAPNLDSLQAPSAGAAPAYHSAPASANPAGQQALFSNPNPARVVSFGSYAPAAERQAQRDRDDSLDRPEPMRQAKVELRHARARKKTSAAQQRLDFFGQEEILSPPQSHIICDAPVAPFGLRVQAAFIDCLLMLSPAVLGFALFLYEGGHLTFDKHVAPFWLLAILTVPVLYKTLWTFAGRDSLGLSCAGLRLVDFDGNPPSRERRYQRMLGGFLSTLAAGVGLVWALVDEDCLTWHDHMSSTFPTLACDN